VYLYRLNIKLAGRQLLTNCLNVENGTPSPLPLTTSSKTQNKLDLRFKIFDETDLFFRKNYKCNYRTEKKSKIEHFSTVQSIKNAFGASLSGKIFPYWKNFSFHFFGTFRMQANVSDASP